MPTLRLKARITHIVKGSAAWPDLEPEPGIDSGALNPEKSDYLFYVTKKDGTQEHLFAKTYKEHLKNIETSKKMAQQ